jgi:exodeoxyribonuclease VII small subunit
MAKQKKNLDQISYDEALLEIETTLEKIETGTLGVDELAAEVARVTRLLKICRDRLYQTEEKIDKILDEPDPEKEPS